MIQKAKKSSTKIPAFTVIDMITGMVIMSIIMSLVFYIFSSFTKQVNDYSLSRANLVALNLFKIEMENEIMRADKIIETPQGFLLLKGDSQIKFTHLDKVVIKSKEFMMDTLYSNVSEIEFKSEGSLTPNILDEKITKISMKVLLGEKEINLYFYKNYSNQEKINNIILNGTRS